MKRNNEKLACNTVSRTPLRNCLNRLGSSISLCFLIIYFLQKKQPKIEKKNNKIILTHKRIEIKTLIDKTKLNEKQEKNCKKERKIKNQKIITLNV